MPEHTTQPYRQPDDHGASAAVADYELVITRVVDAPRDVVFQMWTTPEQARQWWGPKDFVMTEVRIDPRPGGAWHANMRSPQGDHYPQSGIMREVVAPDRIAFTFAWDDDPTHESLITVTFADLGAKTELAFHQAPFTSAESRDSHRDGWNECFDNLDALIASTHRSRERPVTPPPQRVLDYYATPAGITSAGRHAALLADLPNDTVGLIRAVPGLIIHQYLASAYGLRVADARAAESQLRSVEQMLDRILELDSRPLSVARRPEKRLVGICRHFEVLLTSMLRARGIPARVRRGFGAYFDPLMLVDHELTEYWDATRSRWVRVDPQLDEVQRATLHLAFDPLDVPSEQFLIPADAWARCRAGAADPDTFGIFEMRGLWFIASNLVREVAWLNRHEMLPWDVWGAMPAAGEQLDGDRLAFFDRLAEFTRDPDTHFDALRELYQSDDRIRVPARVHNAMMNRDDDVA